MGDVTQKRTPGEWRELFSSQEIEEAYDYGGNAADLHRQVLFTIGLVLFVFIMIINLTLNKILKGEKE